MKRFFYLAIVGIGVSISVLSLQAAHQLTQDDVELWGIIKSQTSELLKLTTALSLQSLDEDTFKRTFKHLFTEQNLTRIYSESGTYLAENTTSTEIREAVKFGDIEHVRSMFKCNPSLAADINNPSACYLHATTESADIDSSKRVAMLRFLLENGANPALKNDSGQTVLHLLAPQGDTASIDVLVEALLKKGDGSLAMPDKDGNTVLHIAARAGHTEFIELLKKKGVDILDPHLNGQNSTGETPSDYARALPDENLRKRILTTLSSTERTKATLEPAPTPPHQASFTGKDLISLLENPKTTKAEVLAQLSKIPQGSAEAQKLLKTIKPASFDSTYNLIEYLILQLPTLGYQVNKDLSWFDDILEISKTLWELDPALASSLKGSVEGRDSFELANVNGAPIIFKLIDIYSAFAIRTDLSPVQKKQLEMYTSFINFIIEKYPATLSVTNQRGNTVLHMLHSSFIEDSPHTKALIVKCIQAGVPVDIHNNNNQTPLHYAAYSRDPSYMKTLLEYGANPVIKNKGNEDTLGIILESAGKTFSEKPERNLEALCILLEYDKNNTISSRYLTHVRTKTNQSLVHVAAKMGSLRCINLLKKKGVALNDPALNEQDSNGQTPSDYAQALPDDTVRKAILAELSSQQPSTKGSITQGLASPQSTHTLQFPAVTPPSPQRPLASSTTGSPDSQGPLPPLSSQSSAKPSTPTQSVGGSNTHEEKQQTNYPLWIGGTLAVTAVVVSGALWLTQRLKQNQPYDEEKQHEGAL